VPPLSPASKRRMHGSVLLASARANLHSVDTLCEECTSWARTARAAYRRGRNVGALRASAFDALSPLRPHRAKAAPTGYIGPSRGPACIQNDPTAGPCNCQRCRSERAATVRRR
jgi:hypothetical protein